MSSKPITNHTNHKLNNCLMLSLRQTACCQLQILITYKEKLTIEPKWFYRLLFR